MSDPFAPRQAPEPGYRDEDGLGRTPSSYDLPVEGWSTTAEPAEPAAPRPEGIGDVVVPAGSTAPRRRRGAKGATREIVETLLLAALIFVGVRLLVLNFKVDGASMRPNLQDGELLLVNRNSYREIDVGGWIDALPFVERDDPWVFRPFGEPERGDIVVFDPPSGSTEPYIKRVLGLPGDVVEIRDGGVFVNGERVVEPYIDAGITECLRSTCEAVTVPEGHLYVLGDNRRNSQDSRSFGTVPVGNVIGRAWVVYWPSDGIGLVPHYDYPEVPDR